MMKDYRDLELFWVNPQPQITVLVGRPPILPVMWKWSLTRICVSLYCWPQIWHSTAVLNTCSSSLVIFRRLFEFGTNNLLAVLYFWKHLLHELINGILSSINFHWFSIFIVIAAYYFVTIAAASVPGWHPCTFSVMASKSSHITKGAGICLW